MDVTKKMLPAENFNAIPHTSFPEVTVEAFVGFTSFLFHKKFS